jgi:predicted RNA-binding Zn-ribbon protein involved in translation (DUF1610 family)
MNTLPLCPECGTVLVIAWRLNADGDRMSHAQCHKCGHVEILSASAAKPSAACEGKTSHDFGALSSDGAPTLRSAAHG